MGKYGLNSVHVSSGTWKKLEASFVLEKCCLKQHQKLHGNRSWMVFSLILRSGECVTFPKIVLCENHACDGYLSYFL